MTREPSPHAGLALLRDKRRSTEVLLLLEIAARRPSRLRELAATLGITVQAVSEHLLRMAEAGLVRRVPGGIRATQEGIRFLHETLRELRVALEREMEDLAIVDTTDAIARVPLRAGQRVGLFMEDGILVADRRRSPSMGVAAEPARRGDAVPVRDLTGIVELRPGRVTALVVPPAYLGGSRAVGASAIAELVRAVPHRRVGIIGASALAIARRHRLPVHFEVATAASAVAAAQRGLDVLVLTVPEGVRELELAVDSANRQAEERIVLRIHHAATARSAGGRNGRAAGSRRRVKRRR